MYPIKDLYLKYIENAQNLAIIKPPIFFQMDKRFNTHFNKKRYIDKKLISRCLTSLLMRETTGDTSIYLLKAKMKKTDHTKCWWG